MRHPAKTQAILWCSYFCFMVLMSGALILAFPELRTRVVLCYLGIALLLACLFGYRASHSNEWFQAQKEKSAAWSAKHPVLDNVLGISFCVVMFLLVFGPDLWRHFFKH